MNNTDDFSLEDCDERARLQREREIREGVEPPPGFTPSSRTTVTGADSASAKIGSTVTTVVATSNNLGTLNNAHQQLVAAPPVGQPWLRVLCADDNSHLSILQNNIILQNNSLHAVEVPRIHSQVK